MYVDIQHRRDKFHNIVSHFLRYSKFVMELVLRLRLLVLAAFHK
jgi:hypothetical protein